MHPTEPKNALLIMRANGWSLRSISKELGVPKSTLFNWESEPSLNRAINVFKSLQLEKLQERYIPFFRRRAQVPARKRSVRPRQRNRLGQNREFAKDETLSPSNF